VFADKAASTPVLGRRMKGEVQLCVLGLTDASRAVVAMTTLLRLIVSASTYLVGGVHHSRGMTGSPRPMECDVRVRQTRVCSVCQNKRQPVRRRLDGDYLSTCLGIRARAVLHPRGRRKDSTRDTRVRRRERLRDGTGFAVFVRSLRARWFGELAKPRFVRLPDSAIKERGIPMLVQRAGDIGFCFPFPRSPTGPCHLAISLDGSSRAVNWPRMNSLVFPPPSTAMRRRGAAAPRRFSLLLFCRFGSACQGYKNARQPHPDLAGEQRRPVLARVE